MAKPINIKHLTEEERAVLVEAIPLLRNKDTYYFESEDFKQLYAKWYQVTNGVYHDDGGFNGFKMAIKAMRERMPLTYKAQSTYDERKLTEDGLVIRKVMTSSPLTSKGGRNAPSR